MEKTRIDGVFHVYVDNLIKYIQQNRIFCGELKMQKIIPDAKIKQWAFLLSSNGNKKQASGISP